MIRGSVLAATFLVPVAAIAGPLDGRWAVSRDHCAAEGDRVPMTISGNTIEFYESACEISSLEPIGSQGAAWTVTRTCQGEGETWPVRSIFALDRGEDGGPRLLVEVDLGDGSVVIRHSCD